MYPIEKKGQPGHKKTPHNSSPPRGDMGLDDEWSMTMSYLSQYRDGDSRKNAICDNGGGDYRPHCFLTHHQNQEHVMTQCF